MAVGMGAGTIGTCTQELESVGTGVGVAIRSGDVAYLYIIYMNETVNCSILAFFVILLWNLVCGGYQCANRNSYGGLADNP